MTVTAGAIRAGSAFVELFTDSSKLEAGLRAAGARLKRFGASVRAVGASMAKMGVAMAVPFASSVKVFADFQTQIATLRVALGNVTEKAVRPLVEEAAKLGRTTEKSASEAAAGMVVLAKAGLKTNEILEAIPHVLNLATASGIEMADSAKAVTTAANAMNIPFSKAGQIADFFAVAANSADQSVLDLTETMKAVGPIASQAGISIRDLLALTSAFAKGGIKGEQAGTALRRSILNLADQTPDAMGALRRLGVEVKTAEGNFRPMVDILNDVGDATAGLGNKQKIAELSKIFGAVAAPAIGSFLSGGKKGIAELQAGLDAAKGFTTEAARIQAGTLAGQWKQLLSVLEGIAIEIGSALVPTVQSWGESLRKAAKFVGNLIRGGREWIPTFAAVTAGILGASAALATLGFVIGGIGSGLAALGAVVGAVVATIKLAVGALLSPIGLAVGAVVALTSAFVDWRNVASASLASVARVAGEMKDTFLLAWGGVVEAVMSGDLELASRVAWAGVKVVWKQGILSLRGLWEDFKNFFVSKIAEAQLKLAEVLHQSWSGIKMMWGSLVNAMLKLWAGFTTKVESTWEKTKGVLVSSFDFVTGVIGGEDPRKIVQRGVASTQRTAERVLGIEQEGKNRLRAIEAEGRAEQQAIIDKHEAVVRALKDEAELGNRLREQQKKDNLRQLREELEAERRKLGDLAKLAKEKRAGAEVGGVEGKGAEGKLGQQVEAARKAASGLGQALSLTGSESRGFFNTFAAAGADIGSKVENKQLEVLEDIREGVRDVADNPGFQFG